MTRMTHPSSPWTSGTQHEVLSRTYLERAEHVFGNLLQRLYALAESAEEGRFLRGTDLAHTVARVESALRALFSYLEVPHGEWIQISAAEVVESLATSLGESSAVAVQVAREPDVVPYRVSVDLRALPVAWRAIATVLERTGTGLPDGQSRGLEVRAEATGGELWLEVKMPPDWKTQRCLEAELWWAVAEKVIGRHGGKLCYDGGGRGGGTWSIRLPLAV